ncbi:LacI family DNA-binding transcriptional regulator [Limosilactobacillus caecicola]|uniref:LacI family DNA-binding transcriptional regulator n=1 Tax=Limosilactobacillus caecicola TaxID=2941332 RepID=UPI00203C7DF0|nr:LacI family DNA-binding transcriptional regulator [Limosilactobacillus caecicola]
MVTIRTIAEKAGVSTSTASRALNDNPRISKETRDNIKAIAKQLGYRPDYSAKNLSLGESNIIGVVFPIPEAGNNAPANPFHIEIMWGIGKAIRQHDYEMMVAMGTSEQDLVNQVAAMAEQAKVQKFVLLYSQPADPVVKYLREHDRSYVIVGHPYDEGDRFVDNDNVGVGQAATNQLIRIHHPHHPAFIQSSADRSFEIDRRQGYEEAMANHQLEPLVAKVGVDNPLLKWLDQHPEVDGLLFADDVLYLAAARQLREHKMPIVCFNNSQWIKLVFNDQNVIDLQPQKLGTKAAELLFDLSQNHVYVPYQVN